MALWFSAWYFGLRIFSQGLSCSNGGGGGDCNDLKDKIALEKSL